MSCVTVKVPMAPEPLACMRRSGMTSRVEMRQLLEQPDVLQQDRAARAGGLGVLIVDDGSAGSGGEVFHETSFSGVEDGWKLSA
jgi:hypothetical protein